jgi:uncharacterized membrane protein YccC
MTNGFTFDQVIVLLGMCATGIVFLYGMSARMHSWTEKQLKERDEARAQELKALREALDKSNDALLTRLNEDRDITKQAVDVLHSRLSNARKEMVEIRQYDKDLKRIEDGNLRILEAIEKLASSMRHRMDTIQQTVTTQVGLRDQLEQRLKLTEDRQTAFIAAGKIAAPGAAE